MFSSLTRESDAIEATKTLRSLSKQVSEPNECREPTRLGSPRDTYRFSESSMISIFPTPCQCTAAGWCPRHDCHKTRVHFEYCRRLPAWFEAWERGERPGAPELVEPVPLARCRQRGREAIRFVTCDLCGERQLQVAVYRCTVFRECTERRYGTRTPEAREMAACLSCDRYDAEHPPPVPP